MITPAPLDYDATLAENVRNEDENSLLELIDRHTPLCYKIYGEYSDGLYASGVAIEDLKGDKDYIMWQAALKHDPTRGKFTTLLGNQIRYQCLGAMSLRKRRHIFKDEHDLEILLSKEGAYFLPEDKSFKEFVLHILDQVEDERIKEVFVMRFLSGEKKTLDQIGEVLEVSKQTIANLLNRGMEVIRSKTMSENCFDSI